MLVFFWEKKTCKSCQQQQFSFYFSFCFRLKKRVIFAVYLKLHYGGFLNFLYFYLFDSSVFAKHSVIY